MSKDIPLPAIEAASLYHDDVTPMEATVTVVAAFANRVDPSNVPDFIASVHAAFVSVSKGETVVPAEKKSPAVSVKKSIGDDFIICLDDGKKFKSLKRHLAQLGMTPDEYREKWGLPKDYPMVAPAYARARSELAKTMGLGRKDKDDDGAADPTPLEQAIADA